MNTVDQKAKHIGTLAPLFSLHSSHDLLHDRGTFSTAYAFIDWLKKTKQTLWQLLPMHPTEWEPGSMTPVPSPYKGYGVGIDPSYVSQADSRELPSVLELAQFLRDNDEWIHDFALFCALRDYFHTDDWRTWDKSLRVRDPESLHRWSQALEAEIHTHVCTQWQLHTSFNRVKKAAAKASVLLSGDLPFYLSHNSPLVWAHQDAFEMTLDGEIQFVSGVTEFPPSFFGRQVWGHPLYTWETHDRWDAVIDLWKLRIRYASRLYDALRFDYAEAFYAYGAMGITDEHNDHNRIGPGAVVFEELIRYGREIGLAVFVEDGGTQTVEMEESLLASKCPGIRIFCFRPAISHYPTVSVAFTTTHDTETLLSFVSRQTNEDKRLLAETAESVYDVDDRVFAKNLRDSVIASRAETVIIPIQDWLLTTDRINIPGSEKTFSDPNWRYRVELPIEEFPIDLNL